MKKRLLTLLLVCFVMVSLLLPVTANAATDTTPAFTQQPKSGDVILDEKLPVTWETNFTPVKQLLLKVIVHPVDGEKTITETLNASATSAEVASGYVRYAIRAYYSNSGFITSDTFTVTVKAPYTADSTFVEGGKITVDTERLAEYSETWMAAFFNGDVTYQWYRNGSAISGATGESYTLTSSDVNKTIHAVISNGSTSMETMKNTIVSPVYVGGVKMAEGMYLPSNGYALQSAAPASGGYAVLKKGVLELHDFTYTGSGRREIKVGTTYTDAVIGSNEALRIAMYGTNTIVTDGDTIVAVNGGLSISAYGATLNAASGTSTVLFANGAIILGGGTYSIKEAYRFALVSTSTVDDIILQAVTLTSESLDAPLRTSGVVSISDSTLNFPSTEYDMIIADKGIEITRSSITCPDTQSVFVSDVAVTLVDCALNIKCFYGFDKGVDSSVSVSISGCTGKIESYGSMFYIRGDSYTVTASGSTELTLRVCISGYFIGDVQLKLNDGLKAGILHQDNSWSIFNGTYTGDWIGLAIGADPQKPHSHSYNGYTGFDDTHHWYECTNADCPDKEGSIKNKAEHVFSNDADAECNSCKYVRVPPHVHTYGDYTVTWYAHWMQCTDPECPALGSSEKDTGYHTFVDGVCSVCGTDSIVLIDDIPLKDGQYMASGSTTVSTTKPSTGYAYYKDNVLTLHDFTLSGVDSTAEAVIAYAGDLQVVLEGSNTLESPDDVGIFALGDLQISGTGSLDMDTYDEAILSIKNLTVTGVTLNVRTDDYALTADDTVTLNNCIVNVAAGEDGIIGYYGVSITGSAVTITECYDGIESEKEITITNSTVTVTNAEDDGIGPDGNVTISNSTVKLNSEYGIYCYGNVTITDSDVTIHSNDTALRGEDLTIQGSDVLLCGNGSDGDEALYVKDMTYDPDMTVTASEYTDGRDPVAQFDPAYLEDYLYLYFDAFWDGWYQLNGQWVYYEDDVQVKDAWAKDGSVWRYMDEDGYITYDAWVKDGSLWCYVGNQGYMVTNNWAKDGSVWRWMNASGYITYSKWVHDGYGWCYINSKGAMDTNKWVKDGSKWCYVGADGYMVTNQWVKDGSQWCYIDSKGYMVTNGWAQDGSLWRWMNASGYITYSKWVQDGYGWCYINSKGYMDTNKWVQDGSAWAYVGADGYMVKDQWVKDGSQWCYIGSDGHMVTNGWAKDSGLWRWMNASGYITYSQWIHDGYGWCYINSKGAMETTEWVKDGKYWAYVGADGYMVKNQWVGSSYVDANGHALTGTHTIDGKKYTFDANGNLIG